MQPRTMNSPVPEPQSDEAAMAAFGIERVPVETFHWNGYRYGTLKHALAAARRAGQAVSSHA